VKPSTGGNNGLFITVERTNPNNPVRNIRVLMPGFDAARAEALPFHPRFLSTIKPFGVVRFMDYMLANGIGPKTWAERARASDRRVNEQQYMNAGPFLSVCNPSPIKPLPLGLHRQVVADRLLGATKQARVVSA